MDFLVVMGAITTAAVIFTASDGASLISFYLYAAYVLGLSCTTVVFTRVVVPGCGSSLSAVVGLVWLTWYRKRNKEQTKHHLVLSFLFGFGLVFVVGCFTTADRRPT